MTYVYLVTTSLRSLRHHKGRSLLAMLGIIIGIASIIAIMAIGNGAAHKTRQQILAEGDNYIFGHATNWAAEGKVKSTRQKAPKKITFDDILSMKNQIEQIKRISPYLHATARISFNGNVVACELKAGNQDFLKILARRIKYGSNFTAHQVFKGSRVIVLGHQTARDLFKSINPIGKTIQIKHINFTVIGVLHKIINKNSFKDPNYDVFMPISTAKKYIDRSGGPNKIPGFVASARRMEEMQITVRSMNKILRSRHHIASGDPNDFAIYDQQSWLNAAQGASNTIALLLLIVASISLLVGGIGIMNIMLVSVTERTQEIGIRMALGAPEKTILTQFLLEAILLCLVGGCLGIGCGLLIPFVAEMVTGWPVMITSSSIMYSCIAMILTGVIFGFYPAYQASKKPPVQALLEQ